VKERKKERKKEKEGSYEEESGGRGLEMCCSFVFLKCLFYVFFFSSVAPKCLL
jgi:hypothetical protein